MVEVAFDRMRRHPSDKKWKKGTEFSENTESFKCLSILWKRKMFKVAGEMCWWYIEMTEGSKSPVNWIEVFRWNPIIAITGFNWVMVL